MTPATPARDTAPVTVDLSPQQLAIRGMHCASCVSRVEGALASVAGVTEANVNLATERATVHFSGPMQVERLAEAVRRAGYDARAVASVADDDEEQRERRLELQRLQRRFTVAAVLAVPVVLFGMFGMFPPFDAVPMRVQNLIELVFATPVQWWAGWPFVRGVILAIRRRIADMNLLVGLGTLTAYLFSLAATVMPGALVRAGVAPHTYFDTSVVIVTLILLGRLLEARAKAGTSRAMRRLLELRPSVAHRVVVARATLVPAAGGGPAIAVLSTERLRDAVEDVVLDDVVVGDVLEVRPGEKVPVDGVVLSGRSSIDASLLTGESMPADVGPLDRVHAGTLNQTGAFRMRAERVGAQSMVMHILRLVQQAQGTKANIARLADRIAAVFVPVVIAIALAAFAAWMTFGPEPKLGPALQALVAVLIIACPCSLGLATPTALIAGTGRGAELGVLLRGADALEAAEHIDTVVFDKTGTLTRGRPAVTDIVPAVGHDPATVLIAAASAGQMSEHHVSIAIVRAARERSLTLVPADDFSALPGRGVVALVGGRAVTLGNAAFQIEQGVMLDALEAERERLETEGRTVVAVAENGMLLGWIAVADTLKPDAPATVTALERAGCTVWMITGDNARTARTIAAAAGIDATRVIADVLPAGKSERIAALQREGRRVAMVGDGINDAPALALADLGIAVGGGTDIAMEASHMTLVRNDLRGVPIAIALARRTMQVIRQNLFWAFAYNALGIPIAAGVLFVWLRPGGAIGPLWGWDGRLHPMIASAAMAMSSVSVVASSLRLRKFRG